LPPSTDYNIPQGDAVGRGAASALATARGVAIVMAADPGFDPLAVSNWCPISS